MGNFLLTLLAFLLAITILVSFHEFGHFLAARCLGIKVLRFSLGFGKILFRYRAKTGTEWCLSAIPLGGYVKMLDERDSSVSAGDHQYAFNRRSPWQRLLVILAGPAFSFLLAFLLFWLILSWGVKEQIPLVRFVAAHSQAAELNMGSEEKIIQINQDKVNTYAELMDKFFTQILADTPSAAALNLKTIRQDQERNYHFDLSRNANELQQGLTALGIWFFPMRVEVLEILPDSLAARVLQPGDQIMLQGSDPKTGLENLLSTISQHPGQDLVLTIIRKQQQFQVAVPIAVKTDWKERKIGFLGAKLSLIPLPSINYRYKIIPAFNLACSKTWHLTKQTFTLLFKMVAGKIRSDNLRGPISIAKAAAVNLSYGIMQYLNFLALISVTLGVINLLPIPLLDGGQALYCLIELVRGKPMSMKVQNIGLLIGTFLLIFLMLLAIINDLTN